MGDHAGAGWTCVLFTGGGGAGSQALASLLAARYEVHFADADPDARPHGVAPGRWHVVPRAADQEFIPRLSALCEAVGVGLLVPGVDGELAALAFERGVLPPVLLPRYSFVVAHLDKLASSELLTDVVRAPVTERADLRARVRFPCIAKPRAGRGSRGVVTAASAWDLDAHIALARAGPSEYVVQERLDGVEYTVTVAADATGQPRAVVPARVALKRGITIRATTTHDSAVTEVCKAIHDAFQEKRAEVDQQYSEMATGYNLKPENVIPSLRTPKAAGRPGLPTVDAIEAELKRRKVK